jgi:tRNA pseudouridine38-40 synthase
MPRYFLEVSYKGNRYSGFQSQKNANTIQAEIEKAFEILQKEKLSMVGSSRTDAGVHALQNYFHFDYYGSIHPHFVYKMNAILPFDIAVRKINQVADNAHSRFDAISREYNYFIYQRKDPFLIDRAYYFPYKLDMERLNQAAEIIKQHTDFSTFSKRKTQVKTFNCTIIKSGWKIDPVNGCLVYQVKANRFLRGMVRALVATMLLVARKKLTINEFEEIILEKNPAKANFGSPAHGLFLVKVEFQESVIRS